MSVKLHTKNFLIQKTWIKILYPSFLSVTVDNVILNTEKNLLITNLINNYKINKIINWFVKYNNNQLTDNWGIDPPPRPNPVKILAFNLASYVITWHQNICSKYKLTTI